MPSVILSRDREDVTESKAKITITAQDFKLPSDTETKEYSNKQYQYSINSGRWQDMSSNSTTITITKNNDLHMEVEISCRITYKVDYYEFVTTETGETTTTERKWVRSETEASSKQSNSVDVYFHPGKFNMGATSNSYSDNNIIAKVLTKSKIDNWIAHFQEVYHWYNQNNKNYQPANQTYPNNKEGIKVISGDPVYAEWFNNCMDAMRVVGHSNAQTIKVKGAINNPPGDLITADLINQMNFFGIE